MQRTAINPWDWSVARGFSQAVELRGFDQVVFCSGQTAIGPDGAPPTTADVGEQVAIALDNLNAVLAGAGMTMADVVKMKVYTTDVDGLRAGGGVAELMGGSQAALTLIGVSQLAYPELKVEIEATAAK